MAMTSFNGPVISFVSDLRSISRSKMGFKSKGNIQVMVPIDPSGRPKEYTEPLVREGAAADIDERVLTCPKSLA
jgi:hypothetical protein